MPSAGRIALQALARLLRAETGIPAAVTAVSREERTPLDPITYDQIVTQQLGSDIAESGPGVKYPALYLYCDKLTNSLHEKFRRFSGTVDLTIEIRVTHDRAETLLDAVHLYVDATSRVLDQIRGAWGDGIFYGGEYTVTFANTRKGGRHYLQSAKISLPVHVTF